MRFAFRILIMSYCMIIGLQVMIDQTAHAQCLKPIVYSGGANYTAVPPIYYAPTVTVVTEHVSDDMARFVRGGTYVPVSKYTTQYGPSDYRHVDTPNRRVREAKVKANWLNGFWWNRYDYNN